MSDDTKDDRQQARGKKGRIDAPTSDERNATIASLERALEEERSNSAALRETVDQLHFKINVLEKSYSTQLAEARSRCEKAEAALAAHASSVAELGTGGEDSMKRLAEMRVEVARLTAECDRLRDYARAGPRPAAPFMPGDEPRSIEDSSLTINELIADAAWARERPASGDSNLNASVREEPEAAPEVMLAPELVFTRGRSERDEDDER